MSDSAMTAAALLCGFHINASRAVKQFLGSEPVHRSRSQHRVRIHQHGERKWILKVDDDDEH
uniref:Uncharacterized protein n=1 Tax=Romanomermis culicivorax TaxID=13658 RepID=A0A915KFQ3_ROMCU